MPNYYRGRSAGKTGTTDNYVDAWFDGFNPKLATAVWMGYIDSRPMPGVFGATYSLPIWGTFYNSVFGSTYIPDFAMPAVMPYWLPWEGKYSKMAPSTSPSPSGSPSDSTSPKPTHTTPATTPPPTHSSSPEPTTTPTGTTSPKP